MTDESPTGVDDGLASAADVSHDDDPESVDPNGSAPDSIGDDPGDTDASEEAGASSGPKASVFGTEPPDRSSPASDHAGDQAGDGAEIVFDDDLDDLDRDELIVRCRTALREGAEYLDMARRERAEFDNFRRRTEAQRSDQVARAAERLVVELLPVLDGCDAAIAQGADDVEPIQSSLVSTLAKQGLEVLDEIDVDFDPNIHEAVLTEPGDDDRQVVVEILRAGYLWNGNVVRPAMVKVRG